MPGNGDVKSVQPVVADNGDVKSVQPVMSENGDVKCVQPMMASAYSKMSIESVKSCEPITVDVNVAKELVQLDHRYLDVRTVDEFKKGHVEGAVNIPYLLFKPEGRVKNPEFLEKVSEVWSEDDFIVLGCASGARSLRATEELLSAGFKHVKNMGGGYAAWVENGFVVNKPVLEAEVIPSA